MEARMEARIIPDTRYRGGYRPSNSDHYRREPRSGGDEYQAYVGWTQEQAEMEYWQDWSDNVEETEDQDDWTSQPESYEQSPYEVYYQQPPPQQYFSRTPKYPQPEGAPTSPAYAHTPTGIVPPRNGGQGNFNSNYGAPRPIQRPRFAPRPGTYDPDRPNAGPRIPNGGYPRPYGPPTGPRYGAPGQYQHPVGPPRAPQNPPMPSASCHSVFEEAQLRPTPQYERGQQYIPPQGPATVGAMQPHLNYHGARTNTGVASPQDSNNGVQRPLMNGRAPVQVVSAASPSAKTSSQSTRARILQSSE